MKMKKIVISSNQIKLDNPLIVLINEFFPECEICIAPSDKDDFDGHPSEFRIADKERRIHHGKKSKDICSQKQRKYTHETIRRFRWKLSI
jgi:hypothetical protein